MGLILFASLFFKKKVFFKKTSACNNIKACLIFMF